MDRVHHSEQVVGKAKTLTNTIKDISASRKLVVSSSGSYEHFHGNGDPTMCALCSQIKEAKSFELAIACVIIANACTIGFEADWRVKNASVESPSWLVTMEWIFLCLFLAELLIRLLAEGGAFIRPSNPLFGWNVFDSLVTCTVMLERLAIITELNFSLARLCRVMRLARVLRFIRLLRACRELRVMATGIMNCGRTLLWSFLILAVFTYMYAIFVLNMVSDWLHSPSENSGAGSGDSGRGDSPAAVQDVVDNFGSLPVAMYTLYEAALDGVNWGEVASPLFTINIVLPISFVLYISVTIFVVLNIITATFVQAAAQVAVDAENKFLDVLDDKKAWLQRVSTMFKAHGGNGALESIAFRELMGTPDAKMLFSEVGMELDHHQFGELFPLFDIDGDGEVDVNEFVQGLSMLGGAARSLDMFRQFKRLGSKVEEALRTMQDLQATLGRGSSVASDAWSMSGDPTSPQLIRAGSTPWAARSVAEESRQVSCDCDLDTVRGAESFAV